MKYLILTLLVLSGCSNENWGRHPKFYKGQKIEWKSSFFYSHVCSGAGTIEEFDKTSDGDITYIVETPREEIGCPLKMSGIKESDIRAAP
jgi:hypothetical protein